ncbi:hypothetical protein [Paucihalobacter ruber]|uniref:hypothetical protein n=1 Tax=Paucihalobacter ruber TaxID=2567861 RepID=UPI001C1ECDEA|nr:hypothetical protein [Paucihalobacter ruber]
MPNLSPRVTQSGAPALGAQASVTSALLVLRQDYVVWSSELFSFRYSINPAV